MLLSGEPLFILQSRLFSNVLLPENSDARSPLYWISVYLLISFFVHLKALFSCVRYYILQSSTAASVSSDVVLSFLPCYASITVCQNKSSLWMHWRFTAHAFNRLLLPILMITSVDSHTTSSPFVSSWCQSVKWCCPAIWVTFFRSSLHLIHPLHRTPLCQRLISSSRCRQTFIHHSRVSCCSLARIRSRLDHTPTRTLLT